MPRKMVVRLDDKNVPLTESQADDEFELQELVKRNPDLLPIEEFGMTGPLLVVGRETSLPSGGVDLVALARSGELLVIEFKTGPQNTDFRRVLAQLLDYGSHMWSMTYDEFEATVANRFFASAYCDDVRIKGQSSIESAGRSVWGEAFAEETGVFKERLSSQLQSGSFSYVLVAQRFTNTVERTANYLNEVMTGPRTYAVELVRFDGDGVTAFETRTILKPATKATSPAEYFNEDKFLQTIAEEGYASFLRELFDACRGLAFRLEWGTSGVSIRMPTNDRPEPLTIAWVFQPGRSGWMGLTDVNFGVDPWSFKRHPSAESAVRQYLDTLGSLSGAERVKAKGLTETVWHFSGAGIVRHKAAVSEALARLINAVSGNG